MNVKNKIKHNLITGILTSLVFTSWGVAAESQPPASTDAPKMQTVETEATSLSTPNLSDQGSQESVTQVSRRETRGAFGVTYFILGGQNIAYEGTSNSNFDVFDSYLSFNYKVNKDLRFAARPAFGYSVAGTNKQGDELTDKSRLRDFSFVMTVNNVAEDVLPPELSYKIQPRFYIPTSDESKETGMIGRLRFEQELNWNFAKYSSLRLYAKPSYFFQKSTTYYSNSNPKSPNKLQTTMMADSEHGVQLDYNLNRTFSVQPEIKFKEKWSNTSEANGFQDRFRSTVVDYMIGLEVRPARNINFTVGLQSEQDLIRTDKKNEISYTILTGGTLF